MGLTVRDYMNVFKPELIFRPMDLEKLREYYDFEVGGLWGFVLHIGQILHLNLSISEIKKKYDNIVRMEK